MNNKIKNCQQGIKHIISKTYIPFGENVYTFLGKGIYLFWGLLNACE